jgi:hypothetical protein
LCSTIVIVVGSSLPRPSLSARSRSDHGCVVLRVGEAHGNDGALG